MFQRRPKVPASTQHTIVFPYDRIINSFSTSHYTPDLTDGRASLAEINQVLAEVKDVQDFYANKTKKASWTLVRFALICIFGYLILILALGDTSSPVLFKTLGIFAGLSLIAFIGYLLWQRSNIKENRSLVKNIFDIYNPTFSAKGLSWQIPASSLDWVELWKDYKIHEGDPTYKLSNNYEESETLTKGKPWDQEDAGYKPPGQVINLE